MNTIRKEKRRARTEGQGPGAAPLVAMNLAREMAACVGAVGEDRNDIMYTALAVGQWLAEVDRPGRWDTLEVAPLLELVPDDPRERGRFLLTLAGLLGYAGLEGHVPEPEARRCLEEVQALSDDPIIKNFARVTARRFRRPPGRRGRGRA